MSTKAHRLQLSIPGGKKSFPSPEVPSVYPLFMRELNQSGNACGRGANLSISFFLTERYPSLRSPRAQLASRWCAFLSANTTGEYIKFCHGKNQYFSLKCSFSCGDTRLSASSAAKIAIDTQCSSSLRWKVHAGFGRRNSGKEDHKGGFNPIMPEANRKKWKEK